MSPVTLEGPPRKLRPRWVRGSIGAGDRTSGQVGPGMDFADFRQYMPGDDVRRLDWSVYARSGDLVVREYETTRQLDVMVVIDTSRSMRYGGKAEHARAIAELIASCALDGGDALTVAVHDSMAAWRGPTVSSVNGLGRVRAWLDEVLNGDDFGTEGSLSLGQVPRPRSLVFWLSDLMFDDVENVVGEWRQRGDESVFVHVLSQDEVEPQVLGEGRHRLEDIEAEDHLSLDLARPLLAEYKQELARWRVSLDTIATRNDGWYFSTSVDDGLEQVIESWSGAGLLQ